VRHRLGAFWRQTFSSLKVPNYRLYFTGQSISLAGTWMQMTAQSWLVLTLTHSSTDLGLTVALQTLPVLLFGPYGGVVADRVDKRRLMIVLQIAIPSCEPTARGRHEPAFALRSQRAPTDADQRRVVRPGNERHLRHLGTVDEIAAILQHATQTPRLRQCRPAIPSRRPMRMAPQSAEVAITTQLVQRTGRGQVGG